MTASSPWVTWSKDLGDLAARRTAMCYLDIPWFGWLHIVNVHMNCLELGFKGDFDYLKQLIYQRHRHNNRGTLLMGDFNAPAAEEAYRHIVWNGQFIDQWFESNQRHFFRNIDKNPSASILFSSTFAVRSRSKRCA